jgi:tetratricopeptide (TPR) repeat protein
MDWPSFSMVGRTFAEVFDNSLLISTAPGSIGPDYLLVGFKGKNGMVLENARKNLSYIQNAKNVNLVDARLLYRLIVDEDLEKLFGPGPVNTDIEPNLEFAAPKLLYHRRSAITENIKERQWLSPQTKAIVDELKTSVDSQIDFADYALSVYSPFKGMVDLTGDQSSQKQRFYSLMQAYCAKEPVDYSLFDDEQLRKKCASIQIKTIEDGIDMMPDRAYSYMYLGILYNVMDMPDQAEKAHNKALEINSDAWQVHLNMAAMFKRYKQFDRALAHYNKAIEINPGLVEAYVNAGMILIQQGHLRQAVERFLVAMQVDPKFANTYNGLGLCFFQQGRPQDAVNWFSKALQIEPKMTGVHTNIAIAYSNLGKLDDAAKHFIKSIEIGPETAEDHNNLGVILARQGKLDQAMKHLKKAMQIDPDYEDARKNLSRVLAERGQR